MANWIYVVEFSCPVEHLKKLNQEAILMCDYHPKVPADALVRLQVEVSDFDISQLRFCTYSNDMAYSNESRGGLHVWKVTAADSFRGVNRFDQIRAEFGV